MIKVTDERPIIDLYTTGHSAGQIVTMLNLPITIRQVQRIVKKAGVIRTISESYKLAIKQGRMTYYHKPEALKVKRRALNLKTRYEVLTRDKYTCVKCGSNASHGIRIEVDHIDNNPSNNALDNLQTLCNLCNMGKAWIK